MLNLIKLMFISLSLQWQDMNVIKGGAPQWNWVECKHFVSEAMQRKPTSKETNFNEKTAFFKNIILFFKARNIKYISFIVYDIEWYQT